ncbi:MAG: energy transducer TonB [Pseudomonadota bacterium]
MGEAAALRTEDSAGLAVAVALHVGVVALLVLQPAPPPMIDFEERMTVSLASEVSLAATAPEAVVESRAAIAPTLDVDPVPPAPDTVSDTPTTQVTEPAPQPEARTPRTATTTPAPPRERSRPDKSTPAPAPSAAPQKPAGSLIGDDFLKGGGSSTATDDTRLPASEIGPSAKASIIQRIVREVKPHWTAPAGADADELVTILAFELNEDGSLKGRPRVIRQTGVTASNRPQAPLHAERAIRAVQLAAPFDLPDEFYNAWKSIRGARFDRNLSR